MRLAFAGTPAFAAQELQALHDAGHNVALVLTQPDRPAGRGLKLQASSVKQLAQQLGLPVTQPRSLRLDGRWPDDAQHARLLLLEARPDALIVAAYGLILPRWRGAAPIQRAIEAGDTQTGITIMQMDEGLDTGDMLLSEAQPIGAADNSTSLHDRLAQQGARLIVQALQELQDGKLPRRAQPAGGVSYARKIEKAEAMLNWCEGTEQLERRIRAFDPFPGACFLLDGQAIKIWRARSVVGDVAVPSAPGTVLQADASALRVACGAGVLELLELQAPGGRRVTAQAFMTSPAGRQLRVGQQLPVTPGPPQPA